MKITIGSKEYELAFGLKFGNEMDKRYKQKVQGGIEFGMGINMAFMYLNQMNPSVIKNIISAALSHEKSKPSEAMIEEYIEEYAEQNDGLGSLFKQLEEELGNSKVLKATIEKFKKNAQV